MRQTTLLGFDLRKPANVVNADWTSARRSHFLLDPATRVPLSVDEMVWPRVGAARGDGPMGLWLELKRFRVDTDPTTGVPVAIGIDFESTDESVMDYLATSVPPCAPKTPASEWLLLGYDVADGGLLSGLSNCGFVPEIEDAGALRSRWAPQLNQHGLFHDWSQAHSFQVLSDTRVPEHAPFFTFGIWSLVPA